MIVYNHGKSPIFISLDLRADPNGAPGSFETKYIIEHGAGIELDILDLRVAAVADADDGSIIGEREPIITPAQARALLVYDKKGR